MYEMEFKQSVDRLVLDNQVCSWGGWVFDCLKISSGARMYYLRKPCWMSSFMYLRRALK